MWNRERIIELRLAPHHCGKHVICTGFACKDCMKINAEVFADFVIKNKDFRIGEATRNRIIEVLQMPNIPYSKGKIKKIIIKYITEDFKAIFNKLGDKNVE